MAILTRKFPGFVLLLALGALVAGVQARSYPAYTKYRPQTQTYDDGGDDGGYGYAGQQPRYTSETAQQYYDQDSSYSGGQGYGGSGYLVNDQELESEVAGLFNQWNKALATGDPQRVAALYAPEAVLLPTVSNRVRSDHEGIVDYFSEFLLKKPQGTINESHIHILTPDIAMRSGVYTFKVVVDGKKGSVKARFSFLYIKTNGKWLILNHHSSKMPEDKPAQPH